MDKFRRLRLMRFANNNWFEAEAPRPEKVGNTAIDRMVKKLESLLILLHLQLRFTMS